MAPLGNISERHPFFVVLRLDFHSCFTRAQILSTHVSLAPHIGVTVVMEVFNAHTEAEKLRSDAKMEIHSSLGPGRLLQDFSRLEEKQLQAVAAELEKGNSLLAFAPQATVARDKSGAVEGITFNVGSLDMGSDPRTISVHKFGFPLSSDK